MLLRSSIAVALIGTIYGCSDARFTPASNSDKNNPSKDIAPSSPSPKSSNIENNDKTEDDKTKLPSINPDAATLRNDLIDPSVAGFLAAPTTTTVNPSFSQTVRRELAAKGITPLVESDFRKHSAEKVQLGRMLFYDRILSGNMTVSCASCHVVWRGTSDGTSLMNDVGAKGLFARIDQPKVQNLLPRNTPPLFNRGHNSFTRLFWDGRVEPQAGMPSGFRTPANGDLPEGLDSVAAAQALFPLTSPEEMLGTVTDNGIAARFTAPKDIWNALMLRIKNNTQYMQMLRSAYPGLSDDQFGIQHIGNALAAFQDQNFRADASPFDRFLKGDDAMMTTTALQGAQIFYGRAQCSTCHAGTLQSDQQFHSIAVPQFGIGKGHGSSLREDYGRGGITNLAADRYKFRTPSLRNVFLSGPWGHDGAFTSLSEYVRHYGAPAQSMVAWNAGQIILRVNQWPQGFFTPHTDLALRQNILNANEFAGVQLSEQDIAWLVEFMGTLTDRSFLSRDAVPNAVPSGMSDFLGIYGLKPEWFNLLRSLSWL